MSRQRNKKTGFSDTSIRGHSKNPSPISADHATKEREATTLMNQGKIKEAEVLYRELISAGGTNHRVYGNLAVICGMQGKTNECIELLRKVLEIKAGDPDVHNNLANALLTKGNLIEAINSYRKAIELNPKDPEIYYNLGKALKDKGESAEAIATYNAALNLNPNFLDAYKNLGNILIEQGDITSAITCYKKVIELKPNEPGSYSNLGNAMREYGDISAAILYYKQALKFNQNEPASKYLFNLSNAELLSGNYTSGWKNYEHRFFCEQNKNCLQGKPSCKQVKRLKLTRGSQILLISEQGLGDTLQFMRYVLALKDQGMDVSLSAPTKLHSLIQTSGIHSSPLTPEEANQVTEGHWMPLLTLPRHLNVSPETPIITEPYIKTSDELISKWKNILSAEIRPIIGINWQGNPSQEKLEANGRSLPLEVFAAFATNTNASLLSLQKGFGSEQLKSCSFKDRFVSCQDQIDKTWDFLETAAIIANCDLVITSDTSVAHLAGGMGKTTWLLLKKVPEWRWGLEGDSSFWYPSMRLFRQKERCNWNEVMERVEKAFLEHFEGSSTPAKQVPATQTAINSKSNQYDRTSLFPAELKCTLIHRDGISSKHSIDKKVNINIPDNHNVLEQTINKSNAEGEASASRMQAVISERSNETSEEYCNRGDLSRQSGDLKSAQFFYEDAVKLDIFNPRALYNLALTKKQLGNSYEALNLLHKVIEIKPDLVEAYIANGIIYQEQGELEIATSLFNKAIEVEPNSKHAYNNLGNILRETGDLVGAIDAYRAATKIEPNFFEAHNNLGLAKQISGDLISAATCFKQAIAIQPCCSETYNNLGLLLQEMGCTQEAMGNFQKALQINPNLDAVRFNLGMLQLLTGNYHKGLKNYEFRFTVKNGLQSLLAKPNGPVWNGEGLSKNQRLILVAEQGLGDTLQFMRYAKVLKSRGFNPSLCAQPKLSSLIKASNLGVPLISIKDAIEDQNSAWLPMLSTLKYLQITPETPLVNDPYIKTSDSLKSKWRDLISQENGFVIGINWQGNPDHEKSTSRGRSLVLESFSPIAKINNVTLLSLQKGYGSEQLKKCSFKDRFVSCQDQIEETWDFLETAAIISNCHLIITCDTSVAHLAGGMGKKTWLLLKKVPEWRWGFEGDTSFWYPSMHLFRQKERCNWNEVMEQVTRALKSTLKNSKSLLYSKSTQ